MTINKHYLQGLGFNQLGSLGRVVESTIEQNSLILSSMLEKQKEQKQYKEGDTLSFDDIDSLYNAGLTFEEKQAWVWFKRSQGVPMTGWDKYFFKKDKKDYTAKKDTIILVTNKPTTVKDNHFRDITEVPKGVKLGTLTRFLNKYDGKVYIIFTTPEGYKQRVDRADVDNIGEGEVSSGLDIDGQIKFLVSKGALFFLNGDYLPYALFSFGNMYDRELALMKEKTFIIDNFGQEVFDNHLKIIERSKPKFLSVSVADPRDRPIILAISPLARMKDMFYLSELRDDVGFDLQSIVSNQKEWKCYQGYTNNEKEGYKAEWKGEGFNSNERTEDYRLSLRDAFKFWLYEQSEDSFREVSAYEIEKYYLNRSKFTSKIEDEEKDTINKYAPQEGEDLFAKFLNEALTFVDMQKLDFSFNKLYNAYADIAYNKVPIGFSCSAFFKQGLLAFSEAQKESIAYMEVATAGILAYDVGVGKTMSAIITLANLLQQGKCKRPLIVVPNQTYRKWIKELFGYENKKTGEKGYGVLSNTGITLNDFYNLGVEVVSTDKDGKMHVDGKSLMGLLPEKSITIVTYEGFKKFGIGGAGRSESFEEMFDILQQNDRKFKSIRDETKYEESLAEALNKVNKGAIVDFNTLGIDHITIDEAHACKNIFEAVKADDEGKVRYQLGSGTSEMGIKAFFFCNSIIRKYGGNVMLLTATPFTNSPVEIYAMLSLVGYKTMQDMRLSNLNTFMCTFVKQSYEYVNRPDGSIEMGFTVKAYTNRQILQKLIYSHIIYKTGEDAGVKRPIKINLPRLKKVDADGRVIALKKAEQVLTYLEPTVIQKENQKDIESMLHHYSRNIGASSGVTLGDIGRMLNKNLDNALSPFLLEREMPEPVEFVEGSPKINYVMNCIRSVKAWHDAKGEECSGQVIYCNRGKDYFDLMQRYLNAEIGFKTQVRFEGSTFNEVELVTSEISANRKEKIKDAFLAGVVKVLIGTSTIREGIDLQRRGTCLYLLTIDWNPTDMKQVEGRIWRQGNEFGYVRVVMPLLQDSMDIFVFQKLEEKTARVNDIWYKAGRSNVLDQEALDPEEIKLALFSKIDVLLALKLDLLKREKNRRIVVNNVSINALQVYKARYSNYEATRANVVDSLKTLPRFLFRMIKYYEGQYKDKTNRTEYLQLSKKAIAEGDELREELLEFIQGSEMEDKELLKKCRKIQMYRVMIDEVNYDFSRTVIDLKVLISDVRKTERTLLTPKGYAPSDAERLMNELKDEQKDLQRSVAYLDTIAGEDEVRAEIVEQKEKYSVQGKTAEERAEEFTNLNYLLTYGANEKAHYHLPSPQEPEQDDKEESVNEEAKAKTRARKIRIFQFQAQAYAYAQS